MTPEQRGDLAERMVPRARELAGLVRGGGDAEAIGRFLRRLTLDEAGALLIVQAAMTAPGAPAEDMLGWVTWDEYGRLLEGMTPVLPIFAGEDGPEPGGPGPFTEPCPSLAAYRRHKAAGEPAEECGCARAARAEWRKQNSRRREARTAAAEEASDAA